MEKKITYKAAMQELEAILARLNSGDADVDQLAAEVSRAGELVSICKEKLRKAESDIEKIIKKTSN